MATVEDINAKQDEVLATQAAQNLKLDEIRAYILSLLDGGASTAQLQVILDKMNLIHVGAQENLAEADALDEPVVPPSE
jgi:hypothetical protein